MIETPGIEDFDTRKRVPLPKSCDAVGTPKDLVFPADEPCLWGSRGAEDQ
jgi:hypothetical protein